VARHASSRGRVYIDITGAGSAAPVPGVAKWTLKANTDKTEVTAMGDTNKSYVAGLPDASGDMSGFWDDTSQQTYTAATDGIARKSYWYPDTSTATTYWFGTALWDFSVTADVGGAVEFSGSWSAASTIARVG
jgi:hypothetical protein